MSNVIELQLLRKTLARYTAEAEARLKGLEGRVDAGADSVADAAPKLDALGDRLGKELADAQEAIAKIKATSDEIERKDQERESRAIEGIAVISSGLKAEINQALTDLRGNVDKVVIDNLRKDESQLKTLKDQVSHDVNAGLVSLRNVINDRLDSSVAELSTIKVKAGKAGKPGKDGERGDEGTPGVGIKDIKQVGTTLLRITLTDGRTFEFKLPKRSGGSIVQNITSGEGAVYSKDLTGYTVTVPESEHGLNKISSVIVLNSSNQEVQCEIVIDVLAVTVYSNVLLDDNKLLIG